jgi:adenylyltransferase/sulfurtransferase
MPTLTAPELARYRRHLVLPEIGAAGQERLKAARVLVIGAGGLGSPVSLYLAAAGVGRLGLVDFDVVDESNLQRQVLYGQSDVGRSKLSAAAARLADVNPLVELVLHEERLTAANAPAILGDYDVVVDGSDNFPTRYLVNDACVLSGKPCVHGSIYRFEGQVAVFWGGRGPCYRCLFPQPPEPGLVPSCAEAGVLGVLPGVIGSLQASEAIKLVLGVGRPLVGRLLAFDALETEFRELALARRADCPVCGDAPTVTELIDYARFCGVNDPNDEEERVEPDSGSPAFDISVDELKTWRDEGKPHVLVDVRTPEEHDIARIEGSTLIPLNELPERLDELDEGADIVVHCHHGPRSSSAVSYLRSRGFPRARNLSGGIDRWSLRIDPGVRQY